MSRAFVREVDDAPEPPPAERTASGAANLVTPRGARLIDETIEGLEAALAAHPDPIREAALRRDLRYWTLRRSTARLVDDDPAPTAVGFGTRVTIRRGILMSDLWIVGEDEADPAQGSISYVSPMARALTGKGIGDVVEVNGQDVEIVDIAADRPTA